MLSFLVQKAYAQGCADTDIGGKDVDLGCMLKLSDGTAVKDVYTTPAFLVNLLVSNLMVIGAFILFLLILYAGFLFISGGSKGKESAKSMIQAGLAGFVLMFVAYWIVQIIQAVTGIEMGL